MKKIAIVIMACLPLLSWAGECKPSIENQKITYASLKNGISFRFAGFDLELPKPDKISLSTDATYLVYKGKRIFLYYMTDTLTNGMAKNYNPVQPFKEAFGIIPESGQFKGEVFSIKNHLDVCKGITTYHIDINNITIVGVKEKEQFQKDTTDIFFFDEKRNFVDKIEFVGFSKQEIDQLLSTIKGI